MNSETSSALLGYLAVLVIIFFISLYIFRAVFNIPSFMRYQKAQIRLLSEIAKAQGVETGTVKTIISESEGAWETSAPNTPAGV